MEMAAKEQRQLLSPNSYGDAAIIDMIQITGIRKGEVRVNYRRRMYLYLCKNVFVFNTFYLHFISVL